MCLTEYDEQKNLQAFKEDGKEEGFLIGMAKGLEKGMAKGNKEGEIKLGKLIEKMITVGRIDMRHVLPGMNRTGNCFTKNSALQTETSVLFH